MSTEALMNSKPIHKIKTLPSRWSNSPKYKIKSKNISSTTRLTHSKVSSIPTSSKLLTSWWPKTMSISSPSTAKMEIFSTSSRRKENSPNYPPWGSLKMSSKAISASSRKISSTGTSKRPISSSPKEGPKLLILAFVSCLEKKNLKLHIM